MSESYGAFAYAYDHALGRRFFRAAQRLLAPIVDVPPPRERTHLDLACGTALAVEYFGKHGYRSTGVDLSLEMLRVGRGRAPRLVAADLRALPFRGTFARITCLYDSLNHFRERDELVEIFRETRRLMDRDSIFLFDMNHPDIYPAIWGMKEPFVESGPSFHLEIATTFSQPERLGRAVVTGWAMLPRGGRTKIRETHLQRSWSKREIVSALRDAGIVAVHVDDFDPFTEGRVVKMVFTCRTR
jgi:SAM-dependent methyltransferase